jgi:RHS repeat-associated protein
MPTFAGRQADILNTFTNHTWDETLALYVTPARFYDPDKKRFISPDPHWGAYNRIFGDNPNNNLVPCIYSIRQAGNLYVYVLNNPLRFIDPIGEAATTAGAGAGVYGLLKAVTTAVGGIAILLNPPSIPDINMPSAGAIAQQTAQLDTALEAFVNYSNVNTTVSPPPTVNPLALTTALAVAMTIASPYIQQVDCPDKILGAPVLQESNSGASPLANLSGATSPGNPDPNDPNTNLRKIRTNAEANKIAQQHGYKSAEALKEDFVFNQARHFNMHINKSTGEIILKAIKGNTRVPTGLR